LEVILSKKLCHGGIALYACWRLARSLLGERTEQKSSVMAGLPARHLSVGLVIPGLGVTRAKIPYFAPLNTSFYFSSASRKQAFSLPIKTKSHPPFGEWAFLLSRDAETIIIEI